MVQLLLHARQLSRVALLCQLLFNLEGNGNIFGPSRLSRVAMAAPRAARLRQRGHGMHRRHCALGLGLLLASPHEVLEAENAVGTHHGGTNTARRVAVREQ